MFPITRIIITTTTTTTISYQYPYSAPGGGGWWGNFGAVLQDLALVSLEGDGEAVDGVREDGLLGHLKYVKVRAISYMILP